MQLADRHGVVSREQQSAEIDRCCTPPVPVRAGMDSNFSETTTTDRAESRAGIMVFFLAMAFFVLWTGTSYLRWANFEYRTFDLAYYVQAVWQLIHGRFAVTVENVPLLGNHVEPIIFLFVPF